VDITLSTTSAAITISSLALAAVALLSAALHDVAFRTVPNWVPVVLFLAGCLIRVLSDTLVLGLTAGLATFIVTICFWHRGWLGGGDVKLLAATVVLVPPTLTVNLLLDVALSGGLLAVLYLTLAQWVTRPSGGPRPCGLLRRIYRAERYRIYRRGSLPYASAIVAGAFLVMLKE
jgi:prepilin peptidase CpaA